MYGTEQPFRTCEIHVNIMKKYVQKGKAKVIFHTFLSSLYTLCISESNFRNDSTCLLHLILGIIMQYKLFTNYESCSRNYYDWSVL